MNCSFLLIFFVDYQALLNTNLLLLAVYGIFHTLIAPVLFYEGIRFIKAQSLGILSFIDPVESVLLALLFLGERLTLGTVIGGIMIFLSIVVQGFFFDK